MSKLLIYGATGYSGELLAERAAACGLAFTVAGRSAEKVTALARRLGVPGITIGVDEADRLRVTLKDFDCVLNVAGPFSRTARTMMEASLATQTHYLDVTGELPVFSLAESLDKEARAAGVMLMPGVGWDVVPSDCLAMHVAQRVKELNLLSIALAHIHIVPSQGSAKTGVELAELGILVRQDDVLRPAEGKTPRLFDFVQFKALCPPVTMGDLVTARRSTGARNIEMYMSVQLPPEGINPDAPGPTERQRQLGRAFIAVSAQAKDGGIERSVMVTESGYAFTALAGIEVARRVLSGDAKPGFQSPASAYGVELATDIGATITDLPPHPGL